jgi:predicted dehydrogenase
VSTPFRWGILGTGRINIRVLPGFRDAGHTIAIVGSRDPARARAHADELGAERTGTYDEVLAAKDVDGVYISLPNGLHREWTERASAAGKHVLCEKPMAPTAADCRAMVAACAKAGVQLVEAFMYRHQPRYQIVRRIIDSGEIGRVVSVDAAFGYRLDRPDDIRLSPSLGGGSTQDVGCYAVNAVRWLLGEPRAIRGYAVDRRGVGVDTHAAAVFEYASGAVGTVACSFDTAMGQWLTIMGERGMIEVPQPYLPRDDATVRVTGGNGDRIESVELDNQYGHQFRAFASLVREGGTSLTPGSDAELTQNAIAAWRMPIVRAAELSP